MSISQVSLFKAQMPSYEEPLIEEKPISTVEEKPDSNDALSSMEDKAAKEREDLENRTAEALWNLTQAHQSLPVISAVGALCLASDNFNVGLGVGSLLYFSRRLMLHHSSDDSEKETKLEDGDLKYISQLDWGNTVLTTAVYEELMYRGVVQGVSKVAFSTLFSLFSNSEEAQKIASVASIVFASVVFGLQHLETGHSKAKEQSISAAIGSIPYGLIRERYGLISSIGAHMANNFWALRSMASAVNSSIKEQEVVEKKETS